MNAKRPPINEVALSVAIAPQDRLVGPFLPEVLGEWFTEHPNVSAVPPYEMPVERQSPFGQPFAQSPKVEWLGMIPDVRYWLASSDDVFVVQTQRNYIAFNWRRRDTEYVSYANLRARFEDLLRTVAANLAKSGGSLECAQAELTYVNLIQDQARWPTAGDMHRLVRLSFADVDEYEQLNLTYTKPMVDRANWRGRMHVAVAPLYDWVKEQTAFSLNLTARSGDLDDHGIDSAMAFLDYAHDKVNDTFRDIVSDEALEAWGMKA